MPRTSNPRIYTLRGCDYEADPNVIPSKDEQEKLHITVIKLDSITHTNMGHQGSDEQHNLINHYIYKFLKD